MVHCNPVQGQYRARTEFYLCTNSHREKPVFITGMGLQCGRHLKGFGLASLYGVRCGYMPPLGSFC